MLYIRPKGGNAITVSQKVCTRNTKCVTKRILGHRTFMEVPFVTNETFDSYLRRRYRGVRKHCFDWYSVQHALLIYSKYQPR